MNTNKKAAGCGDTQTARQTIYDNNYTQTVILLKAVYLSQEALILAFAWSEIVAKGSLFYPDCRWANQAYECMICQHMGTPR